MKALKRFARRAIGWFLFRSGIHRRLLGDRHTIVLFHRVDDRLEGDPLSFTSGEFRAFCDFFGRYFDVISIPELVRRLEAGDPIGGTLSITFDDGYRDNRTIAAPILAERGLPATFYITAGFIGTDHLAPWDAEAGVRSEWMTWSQVRELREMGFDLGAHTVNHVDLGKVHGAEARSEILESRRRLEVETKAPIRTFSYPFGGSEHFTEENRELVRSLGFDACLSAYGGAVRPDDDPHRLLRVAPWYRSPSELGFQIAVRNDVPESRAEGESPSRPRRARRRLRLPLMGDRVQ